MRQRPRNGKRQESHKEEYKRLYSRVRTNRETFSVLEWYCKPDTGLESVIRARYGPQHLLNNSSRGVTPGLIDLKKGDVPGNRVPIPRIKDLPGTSTSVHGFKLLKRPFSALEPSTPERPRKWVQKTPRRSARLQEAPSQNRSSPVAAFEGLSIKSTNNSPLHVIKTIKDKPSGNSVPILNIRHHHEAQSSSSSEGDVDSREISEFERSAVVQIPSSSEGDVSSRDREISEFEIESEYEDDTVPETSKAIAVLEIEDSDTGSPEPVEKEGGNDRLPSRRTTPGRSIDLQEDPVDFESDRLELLLEFLSHKPDNEEDRISRADIPIANMPQVERHPEDLSDEASSIPQALTAATQEPYLEAPASEESLETQASNGLLESLVKEISQLRDAVPDLAPSGSQSADLIGKRVDKLARISLDMQTGAAMLVNEIAALREEIHRLGR